MLYGTDYGNSLYLYNANKSSNINFQKKLNSEEILEIWRKKEILKNLLHELPMAQSAAEELANCNSCKKPKCETICHLGDMVPHAKTTECMKKGNFLSAIAQFNKYPFVGSLCQLCDKICVDVNRCGVNFNEMEKLVAKYKKDYHIKFLLDKNAVKKENGKKAAVIGSGIAGLTAALELRLLGYKVFVFEGDKVVGGQLSRTIPAFKFDKGRWQGSIETLRQLGIKIIPNCKVGRKNHKIINGKRINVGDRINFDRLAEVFDLVFANNGACLQNVPDIKGIHLPNVFSADEFLARFNSGRKIKGLSNKIENNKDKVFVVSGGGDVAIDAALSAVEKGCGIVVIMYRKGLAKMSAHKEKIKHALEKGVQILPYTEAEQLTQKDGKVLMEYTYTAPRSGEKITSTMHVNTFVYANGSKPEPIKTKNGTLPMNKKGRIDTDPETGRVRGYNNVFASGDSTALGSEANAITAVKKTRDVVKYAHKDISGIGSKQSLRKALKEANEFRNKICGKTNGNS